MRAIIGITWAALSIIACDSQSGVDAGIATRDEAVLALAPKPPALLKKNNAPVSDPVDYAVACGMTVADAHLPSLGTAANPIRGIDDATQVGTLTDNDWTLIQHFDAKATDLAISSTLKANLWHKIVGGRDWYYLYRYANQNPIAQDTFNGVLGFDATTICGLDKILKNAAPPTDLKDLLIAGQSNIDRCSDCHIHGFIAPRPKMLAVAKARAPKPPKLAFLKTAWLPKWNAFATAYGPIWNIGQDPGLNKNPVGAWISGSAGGLAAPPNNDCEKAGCHTTKWVPPVNPTDYCQQVFGPAFDANGSMTIDGAGFSDNTTCNDFLNALGCGNKAAGATNLSALCPAAAPPKPASSFPLSNDRRIVIGSLQLVSPSTVRIVPQHNSSIGWTVGPQSLIGDPWVTAIQVWGGPVSGGALVPMTSPIAVSDPDFLPTITVSGLAPNTTYRFELEVFDNDGESPYEPAVQITTPPSFPPPADAGFPPPADAGFPPPVDASTPPDAGSGSGSGSATVDAGVIIRDAGVIRDAIALPH